MAASWISALDAFLRHQDFYWNRTVGGLLHKAAGVSRHTLVGASFTVAICFLIVFGPSVSSGVRVVAAIAVALAVAMVVVVTMRFTQEGARRCMGLTDTSCDHHPMCGWGVVHGWGPGY